MFNTYKMSQNNLNYTTGFYNFNILICYLYL